jgi:hypothetical protein
LLIICMFFPTIFHCTRISAFDQTPSFKQIQIPYLLRKPCQARYAKFTQQFHATHPLFFTTQRLNTYVLSPISIFHPYTWDIETCLSYWWVHWHNSVNHNLVFCCVKNPVRVLAFEPPCIYQSHFYLTYTTWQLKRFFFLTKEVVYWDVSHKSWNWWIMILHLGFQLRKVVAWGFAKRFKDTMHM